MEENLYQNYLKKSKLNNYILLLK